MGFEDYISETEAASIAGVSSNTLNRFAEAGYLQVESDSDGLRLFSRRELGEVFGFRQENYSTVLDGSAVRALNPHEQEVPERNAYRKEGRSAVQEELKEGAGSPAGESSAPVDNVVELHAGSKLEQEQSVEVSSSEPIAADDIWSDESDTGEADAVVQSVEREEEVSQVPLTESVQPVAVQMLEREIAKLKSIVTMQDKLLDMKDAELKDLQEQRTWLHERVERLEEKSDRDQMLLLAETQLVRQMITQRDQKRSPVRAALEWFGLVPDQQNQAQGPVVEGTVERS
jgi:hypothetical protein